MKKLLAMLVALVFSSVLSADSVTGKVIRIYPTGDVVNFRIENDACKPGDTANKYWRFKLYSADGSGIADEEANARAKIWFAMLLSAATSKMPLKVAFTGPCDPTNHEFINYIYQDYFG